MKIIIYRNKFVCIIFFSLCNDRLAIEQQRDKLSKQLSLMKNLVQQLQTRPAVKKTILNEFKNETNEDRGDLINNDDLINELTITLIQVDSFNKNIVSNGQIYNYN